MVVRMLAGSDRHRDPVFAHEVVRQPDVIEIVHLEHDVIEPPLLRTDAEGDSMIAVIAMHEDRRDDPVAHSNLVLDPTAHSQLHIKPPGCRGIMLADNAMAEPAGPGIKPPMHSSSRIKWLTELNFRPMENFNWIAARILQLHEFKHMVLGCFFVGSNAIFDARLG